MSKPKVLDVGQCDADHGSIRRLLEGLGAEVIRAYSGAEAIAALTKEQPKLVLVNRILDADGDDGVRLIGEFVSRAPEGTTVMLVTNYPEYQKKAIALGAVEGFGKSALRDPGTAERLAHVLRKPGDYCA
jgi:CheY-like chemotaxis protein